MNTLRATVIFIALPLAACAGTTPAQAPFDDIRFYTRPPVFPGAEGFGTDTAAGRGGAVIPVTTLAPDGPGSMRAALQTPGPRVVTFQVAGTITITESMVVSEPFITIAGDTAPSPGITITGAGIVINTHDVLMQHIRVRAGDRPEGPEPGGRDCLSVLGRGPGADETYNVVIDHCSFSWAIDEGVSTWEYGVRDVTFSNCIIAENLSHSLHPEGEHSKGMLIGDHARRVAAIRNVFANNVERNPLIKGDVSALVVNNLIYNPERNAIHFSDPEHSGCSRAAIIGNVMIPGADTHFFAKMIRKHLSANSQTTFKACDNRVRKKDGPLTAISEHPSTAAVMVSPLTIAPVDTLETDILTTAGARPNDRDAVDARIIESIRNRTGRIIDSPSQASM